MTSRGSEHENTIRGRVNKLWQNIDLFPSLAVRDQHDIDRVEEQARFFDYSLDLLCIAGLDGYFKRLNPTWTSLLGWHNDELLAKPFIEFVHPEDRDSTTAKVGELSRGIETIMFENRYRHRNGSYLWLQWNAFPDQGHGKIYAAARDISRARRLEQQILNISEREKERMGQEVHDGLCQTLAGIAAMTMTLARNIASNEPPSDHLLACNINKLLNETTRDARDIARGLYPIDLAENGLCQALKSMLKNVQKLFDVRCTVLCINTFPRLSIETERHLFRITQEAVNNAVTHGNASDVSVEIVERHSTGILSITDNGVGIPNEPKSDGIGMHTMDYRARLIGGTLRFKRLNTYGSVVACEFPLVPKRGLS